MVWRFEALASWVVYFSADYPKPDGGPILLDLGLNC